MALGIYLISVDRIAHVISPQFQKPANMNQLPTDTFSYQYARRTRELEGVRYVTSKRGTKLVLFAGNTFTPNERPHPGQVSRNWKCSMYYKTKCRARVITRHQNGHEYIRPAFPVHTHPTQFPQLTNKIARAERML